MELTKAEIRLVYQAILSQNYTLPNAQILLPLIIKMQVEINKWDEEIKKEKEEAKKSVEVTKQVKKKN